MTRSLLSLAAAALISVGAADSARAQLSISVGNPYGGFGGYSSGYYGAPYSSYSSGYSSGYYGAPSIYSGGYSSGYYGAPSIYSGGYSTGYYGVPAVGYAPVVRSYGYSPYGYGYGNRGGYGGGFLGGFGRRGFRR